jgi:DNA-binding response OmpR family regulator
METNSKKPRVLFIEDNPDTRQIYKDVLEREGFQVLLAEDGEKGLSYAQATLPDLIMLDLMLPKVGGFDVLKQLKESKETQGIPVLIFSALSDSVERQRAMDLGAKEFSLKAVNTPKQVAGKVRAMLAKGLPGTSGNGQGPALRIAVKNGVFDAASVLKELGLAENFKCPQCHSEVALSLIPDPTRTEGHWFAAHFVCSNCQRAF